MTYTHEAIIEQAAALGRDGYDTASNMLYAMAAQCYPANPNPAWQQELQAQQVRLGLMPSLDPDPTVHNDGQDSTDDMGQTQSADPPSSEEPAAGNSD